jgi:hypothetical protein
MFKAALCAAILSAVTAASAWAAPAVSTLTGLRSDDVNSVTKVRRRRSRRRRSRRRRGRGRRFRSRPRYWREWNCYRAGPFWICP